MSAVVSLGDGTGGKFMLISDCGLPILLRLHVKVGTNINRLMEFEKMVL